MTGAAAAAEAAAAFRGEEELGKVAAGVRRGRPVTSRPPLLAAARGVTKP
jgi:hypothetical protein